MSPRKWPLTRTLALPSNSHSEVAIRAQIRQIQVAQREKVLRTLVLLPRTPTSRRRIASAQMRLNNKSRPKRRSSEGSKPLLFNDPASLFYCLPASSALARLHSLPVCSPLRREKPGEADERSRFHLAAFGGRPLIGSDLISGS